MVNITTDTYYKTTSREGLIRDMRAQAQEMRKTAEFLEQEANIIEDAGNQRPADTGLVSVLADIDTGNQRLRIKWHALNRLYRVFT